MQGREGRLLRRVRLEDARRRLPLRRARCRDQHEIGRHHEQADLHRLVGRQRLGQAEDAVRLVQGRAQEGPLWHQRGVPGDRPRRPRPRRDQEEGRLRLSGSV